MAFQLFHARAFDLRFLAGLGITPINRIPRRLPGMHRLFRRLKTRTDDLLIRLQRGQRGLVSVQFRGHFLNRIAVTLQCLRGFNQCRFNLLKIGLLALLQILLMFDALFDAGNITAQAIIFCLHRIERIIRFGM